MLMLVLFLLTCAGTDIADHDMFTITTPSLTHTTNPPIPGNNTETKDNNSDIKRIAALLPANANANANAGTSADGTIAAIAATSITAGAPSSGTRVTTSSIFGASSSLGLLYAYVESAEYGNSRYGHGSPIIVIDDGEYAIYRNGARQHEAAYDAYITGVVFIRTLYAHSILTSSSSSSLFSVINKDGGNFNQTFGNRINVLFSEVAMYINGNDTHMTHYSNVFFVDSLHDITLDLVKYVTPLHSTTEHHHHHQSHIYVYLRSSGWV
jgi:hypothetical protein